MNTFGGGTMPTSAIEPLFTSRVTKNSSAFSLSRALRIAGPARIVLPISDNATKRTLQMGPVATGRKSFQIRSKVVASAHSGTPAQKSMLRMVLIFIGIAPQSDRRNLRASVPIFQPIFLPNRLLRNPRRRFGRQVYLSCCVTPNANRSDAWYRPDNLSSQGKNWAGAGEAGTRGWSGCWRQSALRPHFSHANSQQWKAWAI